MAAKIRTGKIVALDWNSETLRVVHAVLTKRGVKIDRILSAAIPSDVRIDDPARMGAHVRRVLDAEGIGATHAVVDIPRDQAILKTLSLPTTRSEELPGMVEIQIGRELPFPADEAVIDFVAASEAGGEAGSSDVLVAVVRREVLSHYEAVAEHAGLKVERVGLRPHANGVAVRALLRHSMPEHVLFIDVGPSLTEIDVLKNGSLMFSRAASVVIPDKASPTIDRGGLRFTGVEDEFAGGDGGTGVPVGPSRASIISSLIVEVTRSVEAYRTSDAGAAIDFAVIGGDTGVEDSLSEALQDKLGFTTQLYNPASTFGWEPDEGAAAAGFASALGLVLSHADAESLHFDFRHPKRTESQAKRRLRKAPLAAAIGGLFITAAGISVAQATKEQRKELAQVESEIAALEEDHKDRLKFLEVMAQLREFDKRQLVWVDVMYDVFALMPSNEEWLITNLELNQKENRVTLKTKAKNRDTALEVGRRMEEFRREGRDRPRYDVHVGGQSEKKGEKYPFQQDVRITILDDEAPTKASGRR